MVGSSNFICALITFFLLNGARTPTAEGIEWIIGNNLQLALVNDVVDLLNKLDSIPSNDTTRTFESIEIINNINSQIEGVCDQIAETKEIGLEVVRKLKYYKRIQWKTEYLQEVMTHVQSNYQHMKFILQNSFFYFSYDHVALKEFAQLNVVNSSQLIDSKVFDAFLTYFGDEHERRSNIISLVDQISELLANTQLHKTCHMISLQQLFFNNYLEFTILEFQGYLIKKFSEIVLFNLGEENLLTERIVFNRTRDIQTLHVVRQFQKVVHRAAAGRELWRCDPSLWKENENFEQLTRLIQGYVVNEASLNSGHSCTATCYDIPQNRTLTSCFPSDHSCNHSKGIAKVISCHHQNIHDYYTICPSIDPTRRYQYIETNRGYKNNKVYGQKGTCPNREFTVKSWNRGFVVCSYCFCLIDENSERSDRYFSLQEAVSDIDKNMVVTGLKFVKVNRVIHLQIQQGELAPFGMIKSNTTKWKNVEQFKVTEKREGIDYVTLNYNRRSVSLDDIITNHSDYILTGVKLSMPGPRLYMEVQISKFNFELGTLIEPQKNTKWIHKTPSKKQVELPLKNRQYSTQVRGSVPSPSIYTYFQFTHSDKNKDAAQTTLPFIDSQDVTAHATTPLSGAGLYHKGYAEHGGFLAPKIFALDMSPYIPDYSSYSYFN